MSELRKRKAFEHLRLADSPQSESGGALDERLKAKKRRMRHARLAF
jgi:hypothetical protein